MHWTERRAGRRMITYGHVLFSLLSPLIVSPPWHGGEGRRGIVGTELVKKCYYARYATVQKRQSAPTPPLKKIPGRLCYLQSAMEDEES